VPTVFYQLFTLFAPFADAAFPVVYALMSRKTHELYTGVFTKVPDLIPDFSHTSAMADFEEASAAAFKSMFGDVAISGCWFHFASYFLARSAKVAERAICFTYRNFYHFFIFRIFFNDISETNYLKIRRTDFRNLYIE